MELDALVQAPDPSYLVRAEKELLEHGEHIDQADGGDFICCEPKLLHEATLVDAFDLLHALVDDVQLLQVGEVLNPIDPVDIIQAEVNRLNVGHVLLVDAEEVACVVKSALHGAGLAAIICIVVLAALSDAC